MTKRIQIRLLVIAVVTVLCVYLFAGFPPSMSNMKQRIRLGLDLRGGTHLVLQVVTDDAIRAETDQTIESLRSQLQTRSVTFRQITRTSNNQFSVVGVDSNKDTDFRDVMSANHPEWDLNSGGEANSYNVRLKPAQEQTSEIRLWIRP